jgi:CheY-like chemotaxis protein
MIESRASMAPLKVLLVEDEPLIAMTITDILEEFGHSVFEAVSAKEAISIFEAEQGVDLLITDLGLPDMPGEQLASKLREARPDLPILFATGRSADSALAGDQLSPPLERLSKPFLMNELQAAIERLMASA